MAFALAKFGSVVVTQNTQALAQSLVVDKRTVKDFTKVVKKVVNDNWKPLAAVSFVAAATFGALKLRAEYKRQEFERSLSPCEEKARKLKEAASLIEVGASIERGLYKDLDDLANDLMEELELEDCLESDQTEAEMLKYVDTKLLQEVDECKDERTKEVILEKIEHIKYGKSKKRIRHFMLPNALKALVSKARASFPVPDGSKIQQKAIALYLAKEGRKLHIRESQLSVLIPKAVALASIPTDAQIDARNIMNIESVKVRFNKMEWQGVRNERSWLNKLVSVVSNFQ